MSMTSVRLARIAASAEALPLTVDEGGFRVLSAAELTPSLASQRVRQNTQGLRADLRVVVPRELDGTSDR